MNTQKIKNNNEEIESSNEPLFPVIRDPLVDILTPNSQSNNDNDIDDIPEEIKALFEIYGLSKKSYRVMLKEYPDGIDPEHSSQGMYVKSWSRSFPSIEWIALNYGPGNYELCFQFRTRDENGNTVNKNEKVPITISEKFAEAHEDFIFKKKLRKIEEKRKQIGAQKLSKALESTLDLETNENKNNNNIENMLTYVKQFCTLSESLGLTRQQNNTDWSKILSLIIPAIPTIITYFNQKSEQEMARQREYMTLLLSTISNNNNNLLDIMKSNAGIGSGNMMIKEFKDMVMGALDIKKALNESSTEPNNTIDRIFNIIESVGPMILRLATINKEQREKLPQYTMAKIAMETNPDLQQLKNNSEILSGVVKKWDAHYGWKQTDMILDVANMTRPQDCPRLPHQEFPAGDPRNNKQEEKDEEIKEEQNE